MTTPQTLSEQVLALPAGAGGVQGLGETFAADPFTGTGRLSIPIPVPEGHNGQKPALSLVYSSGAGAGICGVGWSFGIGAVRRQTRKGVPTYGDGDVFILGDDELIAVGPGRYVQRREGRFARIEQISEHDRTVWVVTDKDGTRSIYGRDRQARTGDGERTSSWHLTETCDRHDNRIQYTWVRDEHGKRPYLEEISWGNGAFRIQLTYEARPDILSSARTGLLVRTGQRLKRIEVQIRRTSTGVFDVFDLLELDYVQSPITGLSLLASVVRTGVHEDGSTRKLPAMSFMYEAPAHAERTRQVEGHSSNPLVDPRLALVDMDGSGLPDLLEVGSNGYVLRRNLGEGRFSRAFPIRGPAARLGDPGMFLSDATGTGAADLVTPGGYYPNDNGKGFGNFQAFSRVPGIALEAQDVRWLDVNGDGVGDVLAVEGKEVRYAVHTPGAGFGPVQRRLHRTPLPSLRDPWVRTADTNGDGLADLVQISRGGLTIWQNLGLGRFADPQQLAFPEALPPTVPADAIRLVDLTGTGASDVLVVQPRVSWLYVNGCGSHLLPRRVLAGLQGEAQEAVDLLGTGVRGLLVQGFGSASWRFVELWEGRKPDLLRTTNNGMGLATTIEYGSSVVHRRRDGGEGTPWRYPLPYPIQVIDRIESTDQTTGFLRRQIFSYHHGYHDPIEREFRGFAKVTQRDLETAIGDQGTSPAVTVRFFHVGHRVLPTDEAFPLPVELPNDQLPDFAGARRALRGVVYREEVYGLDGMTKARRPYQVNQTAHTVLAVAGPRPGDTQSFFVAPTQTDSLYLERSYDWRHSTVRRRYDALGRVIEEREIGHGRRGSFTTPHENVQTERLERYSVSTYTDRDEPSSLDLDAPYAPTYLVAFPAETSAYAVTPGGDVLLSRERYFYDGVAEEGLGYPGSGTSPGITRGNLHAHLVLALDDGLIAGTYPVGSGVAGALSSRGEYLTDGTDHYIRAARLTYDGRGMPIRSLDPRGNLTTVVYDSAHGLFPMELIDAAGHPTTLSRGDFPHQVISTVDANGNHTSFAYDPSGLPASTAIKGKFVAGAWQGDPETHPTESYTYDFDVVPTRVEVRSRQVRLGDTHTVVRYLDGAGRTLQERHQAEPDPASPSLPRWRVTGWQVLNDKGLVVRAYQPTFAATDAYANGDQTTAYLETTYDPLGRPVRVTYPDGTYESTTYHPWRQEARDRNDNAGAVTIADPRYGSFLDRFHDHLDTPTTTWVDALGRMIAVGEDNGVALGTPPEKALRICTYELAAGAFSGTSYTLFLDQDLAENYFVMVLGTVDAASPDLDNVAVRVSADPFGTGDLATTSNKNEITLVRGASDEGDWQGTIIVWECVADPDGAGFRLRDAREVTMAATTTTGAELSQVVTTNARWKDLDQVACYGGLRGGGVSTASAGASEAAVVCAKIAPSGDDTLTVSRWGVAALGAATFTVYVVEWGREHTLQRVTVSGNAGGDGVDVTSEYDTAPLATAVSRTETWCWMSGWAKTNDLGSGFPGLALALGNGVASNPTESSVAVGSEHSVDRSVIVTVHSHAGLAVDWHKEPDGNASNTSVLITVDAATEAEIYDEASNPRQTAGRRLGLAHATSASASADAADVLLTARPTATPTLTLRRQDTGNAFAAWVQAIDTAGVTHTPHQVHITRSVYDLKDQLLEVFDARELGFATWAFSYDHAGNRIVTAHATAMGTRYALSDAAGNPTWARDARNIEVDRTFDALNRPLTETSDDGSGSILRRQWRYIAYNPADPDFATHQAKNLFGQVEEAREADGLRFFEYDWRGLVLTTRYRFWAQQDGSGRAWDNSASDLWSTGSTWDPAIPSAPRSALTTWLVLDDLTDTTTVTISMTYDAAARPTQVDYPEGMATRVTYNAATTLDAIELDRGTGAGFTNILTDLRYDARGKLTGMTHGNGILTQRTYDTDLERLTRIFTELPGAPAVHFQDLRYDYDPAGNPVQIEDALSTSSFKANQIIPNTRTFHYDPRNRLVRATGKKHATVLDRSTNVLVSSPNPLDYDPYDFTYAYDAVGNFQINQEYNSSRRAHLNYKKDRIDLFNGANAEALDDRPEHGNYRYDNNGNTTHTPRQQELGYTFDNQPSYVDLGGGGQVRYFRHADQRAVRMVNKPGVKALGVYLGPWEYHQRQGSTAYSKVVVHVETTARHAQVERVLAGSDPDSLDVFYVHTDHLGSGHVLTNGSGALLSQEEYFPHGRASDRRDARNRYRYIGVERDADTGLCMTGPRTYDPVVGRFGQGDPIAATAAGRSPYGYASASPILRLDPGGYADKVNDHLKVVDRRDMGNVQRVGPDQLTNAQKRQVPRGSSAATLTYDIGVGPQFDNDPQNLKTVMGGSVAFQRITQWTVQASGTQQQLFTVDPLTPSDYGAGPTLGSHENKHAANNRRFTSPERITEILAGKFSVTDSVTGEVFSFPPITLPHSYRVPVADLDLGTRAGRDEFIRRRNELNRKVSGALMQYILDVVEFADNLDTHRPSSRREWNADRQTYLPHIPKPGTEGLPLGQQFRIDTDQVPVPPDLTIIQNDFLRKYNR